MSESHTLRSRAFSRLFADRIALFALLVISTYALLALLVAVGLIGEHQDARVGAKYLTPSLEFWMGTDRQGRDILLRAVVAIKVAFSVGLVAASISVAFGTLLGAVAGFFGGLVDELVVWLYSTVQSVPHLLLLIALAYISGRGMFGLYLAFSVTSWVTPCRVVRGETLKLRQLDFVQAARALGYGRMHILIKHVLPNTWHLALVNFALLFIGTIKSEVILSYLGLGVQGEPSWGTMIDQARSELINGFFWQLLAATGLMFILVLAFNIFTDALQDALDPKNP